MAEDRFPYREDEYPWELVSETLSDGSVVWVASHPDLDGCMAHGATEQEARVNLSDAFDMVVAHLLKYHLSVPGPGKVSAQQVTLVVYMSPSVAPVPLAMASENLGAVSYSSSALQTDSEWLRQIERFQVAPSTLKVGPPSSVAALAEVD
jgi:predicted RNase H-like HicB family nuclease